MKKIVLTLAVLAAASIANAANVPSGVTGLWRFQTSADKLKATIGTDLVTSHPDNSYWYGGSFVQIGTDANPNLFTDNGLVQERAWDYLTVTHGIAPNGGGSYVNKYTVAIDYLQNTDGWNSLYQTSGDAHAGDGELFINGTTRTASTIGIGAVGYSTLTFDSSMFHRIVWSVDNGNFFRVYVDGTLFLDGAGQAVDGRFSLDPSFHLFADNDWEDQWGLVETAAVWDHALTSEEVAGMGGVNTPLTFAVPEPSALSLLAIGGLFGLIRRNRK